MSALDAPGQAFWDPEADAALFTALETHLVQTADRRLVRVPCHINDRCSPARRSSSTLKSPNTEDRRHAAL